MLPLKKEEENYEIALLKQQILLNHRACARSKSYARRDYDNLFLPPQIWEKSFRELKSKRFKNGQKIETLTSSRAIISDVKSFGRSCLCRGASHDSFSLLNQQS